MCCFPPCGVSPRGVWGLCPLWSSDDAFSMILSLHPEPTSGCSEPDSGWQSAAARPGTTLSVPAPGRPPDHHQWWWVAGRGRGRGGLVPSFGCSLSFCLRINLSFRLTFRQQSQNHAMWRPTLALALHARVGGARLRLTLFDSIAARLVLLRLRRVCGWAAWRPALACPSSAREDGRRAAPTYALAQRRGLYCCGASVVWVNPEPS